MGTKWNKYKIGDLLKRQYDSFHLDDTAVYTRITIRTKGQGISKRDAVAGSEIGTKRQFRVKENQFLLSKIDAMNGAFGIVPNECDQGIITGNFWTYDYDENLISKEYLQLLSTGQVFTDFSKMASSGSTNRKYLNEDKFLDLEISIPSPTEQNRIVKKLELIKSNSDEIKKLRSQQSKDIANLLYSKYVQIIADAPWEKMELVAPITRRPVEVKTDGEYPEMGIRSFGKGTFHKPSLTGLEVGTKKLFRISAGDLMFSNVFAWEGAIAVAQKEDHNRVASHRFISCLPDSEKVSSEFLCYHFLTPKGMEDIGHASPGGAGRNRTLGLKKLEAIKVPIPSISQQKEFTQLQNQLKALQLEHEKSLEDLDKLFPSLLDKAFKGEL